MPRPDEHNVVKDLSLYRVLALLRDDELGDVAAEFGFGSEQASEDRVGLMSDMIESGLVSLPSVLEQLPPQVLASLARSLGCQAATPDRDDRETLLELLLASCGNRSAVRTSDCSPQPQPVRSSSGVVSQHEELVSRRIERVEPSAPREARLKRR